MRKGRWMLLAWIMLAAVFAGGISVSASEAGSTETHLVATDDPTEYELICNKKFPGGLAAYASGPQFRTMSLSNFPGSYGAQLDGLSRTIYDAMVQYFVTNSGTGEVAVTLNLSFSGKGSISDINDSEEYERAMSDLEYALSSAFGALLYDYPELYWADALSMEIRGGDSRITQGSNKTWKGIIYRVYLSMDEIYTGAKYQKESFDKAVDKAVDKVKKQVSSTPYDKIKQIHDYICEQGVYPSSNLGNAVYHSAAGLFLKGGTVVCEGYAKAFMILCRQAGIKAILVVGDAGGAHMWNYVQLDGKWYAVDATWDDISDSNPSHTYFLIGSNTIVPKGQFASTRVLYPWFTSPNSKRFSYPILNGTAYKSSSSTSHIHSWITVSVSKPSCTRTGKTTYRCQTCNETSYDYESELGHSYVKRKYVYNNDATVFKDGTKSLVCDNCGAAYMKVTAKGTKLKPTISLNAKTLVLKQGQSTTALKVKGLAKGDSVKSWSSSNTKVFKVSKSGKITAKRWSGKATKKATLTIKLKSGLKKTVKVSVQAGKVKTSKISGIKAKLSMKAGTKKNLHPAVKPITSQQKVTYHSSNKKVVSVSSSGKLTAKKKGTATITVKSGSKKVKCKVTVK